MSKNKFCILLMALVAMSYFKPSLSFAQTRPLSNKIKTPNTKNELSNEDRETPRANTQSTPRTETPPAAEDDETETSSSSYSSSSALRRVRQHGLGLGLGQTFLLGNYGKTGEDKITVDALYSYAASYSFDLLVNAHMSEHKDKSERMKVMGLTTSIKGRIVEYDNFSPFFLAGLGFYAPKARREVDGNYKWSTQKVTFGANFGGGVDLRLNEHYMVGVLGQMHWPFKVDQDQGPDLKGYYFKLLLTGMYLF